MREQLLHPYDAYGSPIDASFRVETLDGGGTIFFASRGGTKGTAASRNSEYHVGLTTVLTRLKELEATITDILLDSAAARKHPPVERRLRFPPDIRLPIELADIEDVDALRRSVSEAQRDVLAAPGRDSKHGNRVRSIRILFSLAPDREPITTEQIAQFLVGDPATLPTPDPTELNQRSTSLRSRGRVSMPVGNQTPAVIDTPSAKRFCRLPSVVAYVLQRAAGKCELCENRAFVTDGGETYLEVHHVIQLAVGGPDTPRNAVALCPNCHRELHHGVDRARRITLLYERVPELLPA